MKGESKPQPQYKINNKEIPSRLIIGLVYGQVCILWVMVESQRSVDLARYAFCGRKLTSFEGLVYGQVCGGESKVGILAACATKQCVPASDSWKHEISRDGLFLS